MRWSEERFWMHHCISHGMFVLFVLFMHRNQVGDKHAVLSSSLLQWQGLKGRSKRELKLEWVSAWMIEGQFTKRKVEAECDSNHSLESISPHLLWSSVAVECEPIPLLCPLESFNTSQDTARGGSASARCCLFHCVLWLTCLVCPKILPSPLCLGSCEWASAL